MLRAEPDLVRPVATGPTVSRLIATLASSGNRSRNAIRSALPRHERVWALAGDAAPDAGGRVIVAKGARR